MATVYYVCDGVVSTVGKGTNQGLKCSTGWNQTQQQTNILELTGDFITLEQGRELFLALAMLFTVIAIYRALGRSMF